MELNGFNESHIEDLISDIFLSLVLSYLTMVLRHEISDFCNILKENIDNLMGRIFEI